MDVSGSIEPGADFVDAIERAIASSGVVLVMIGSEWLRCTDGAGRRRLDDPGDFIRLETATALGRGARVIPVLVEGARMPRPDELPADLRPLARIASGGELSRIMLALKSVVHADNPGVTLVFDEVEDLSWNSGKAHCESLGGYLTVITSEPEAAFIAGLCDGRYMYLGHGS